MTLLIVVEIITLISLGVYLLSTPQPVKEVARWVAGVGSIVWAVLLLIPGL